MLCNDFARRQVANFVDEFQFPFRRDVLCNAKCGYSSKYVGPVSIPFSSGCALQSHRRAGVPGLQVQFQFPFRRDVLCNSSACGLSTSSQFVSIPFSSGCALQFTGKL